MAPVLKRTADHAGYYHNNQVKLIQGGEPYFKLLENILDQAESTIHLQTYIFEPDETGRRIARALLRAAERKVKVAILLDGYASQNFPLWLTESFLKADIRIEWFQPFLKSKNFYVGRRLHHKIVVVDGFKVLTGGINISDRYNDTTRGKAWLDWAIYVEGTIGIPVRRVCERRSRINWMIGGRPTRKSWNIETDFPVRVRINDWVNRKMQIWNSYMEMFRSAKSHIIIMSPYFMPGKTFRKKISEARKRGVRIMVILGSQSDVKIVRYAEQHLYSWLLRNDIEIYEYQKNILHGKIATYDGKWVTCGSYNINNISAYASIELNLDIEQPAFAREAEQQLFQIIEQDCTRVNMHQYKTRASLFQRFLYRSAYDIIRVLFFLFTFAFRQRD